MRRGRGELVAVPVTYPDGTTECVHLGAEALAAIRGTYRDDLADLVRALWGDTPGVHTWDDTLRLAERASQAVAGECSVYLDVSGEWVYVGRTRYAARVARVEFVRKRLNDVAGRLLLDKAMSAEDDARVQIRHGGQSVTFSGLITCFTAHLPDMTGTSDVYTVELVTEEPTP